MTTILAWLAFGVIVGCFTFVTYVALGLISESITRWKERASSDAAWALLGARDRIQQREHEILDPRPVELWAHEDCSWCRAQIRDEIYGQLGPAAKTAPIPGDSRRR